jgi:hypothetical protein
MLEVYLLTKIFKMFVLEFLILIQFTQLQMIVFINGIQESYKL